MWTKLRNAFVAGIAVIFPATITIVIIRLIVIKINSWILNPFINLLSPYLNGSLAVYAAKMAIFIISILSVCLIGWAANIIVFRKFFGIWERLFLKIPMFGRIYNAIKQISTAFLGQGKTVFRDVVLVEYPRKGVYSLGFVTGKNKGEIQAKTKEEVFNVFIPTTPNPTSGIFLLVPKNELLCLNMSVEEGMKMVISGGAVTPEYGINSKV